MVELVDARVPGGQDPVGQAVHGDLEVGCTAGLDHRLYPFGGDTGIEFDAVYAGGSGFAHALFDRGDIFLGNITMEIKVQVFQIILDIKYLK